MEAQDPRIGTSLKGKWRLDALLGRGGMATVYAATHRNGKRVAVKVLHPEFSRDAAVRERFVREGYLANKVGRGAVAVDDDDVTDDGAAFLVMELLDGETLDDRRERSGGRLAADEVVALMDQVLATLAVAHGQGIVHRDLKPENIFLTRDGVVKLLDFGIARLREESVAHKTSATVTGTVMGTPSYLPPEQARGRWDEVDARSDLWAVGATMFALLTGRCVHEGETVPELLLQAMTVPAPPLCSVAPEMPAELAAIVDRALARDKGSRWPDASTMGDALRALSHEGTSGALEILAVAPATTEPSGAALPRHATVVTMSSRTLAPTTARSRRSRAFVAVGGVAGVVLAAWFVWPRTTASPRATSAAAPPVVAARVGETEPVVSVRASETPTLAAAPTVAPIAVADLPDVAPPPPSPKLTKSLAVPRATGVPVAPTVAPKPKTDLADLFPARR